MNKIKMAIARLSWVESFTGPPMPYLLRGAIAAQFPDQPIFHQHTEEGVIYRYPLIQYRWDKNDGLIVAFGEGADSLSQVPFLDVPLRLGEIVYHISDVRVDLSSHIIKFSPNLMRYFFRSPWLPFNQENYTRYQGLTKSAQQMERDRIAVANILSALKGLNIYISEHLYAGFMLKSSRICRYKDAALFGCQGTLLTNIELPSGFAIGKAVSHGYGWLERVQAT